MYLFAQDGTILGKVTNSVSEHGINYSDDFRKAINESREKKLHAIALHNHPEGTPPSADDFKKAYENQYGLGVIVGNNGQIYTYKNLDIELSSEVVESMAFDIQYLYSLGTDIDTAAKQVYNAYGLDYTIIGVGD